MKKKILISFILICLLSVSTFGCVAGDRVTEEMFLSDMDIAGDIDPDINNIRDLGSNVLYWNDLWVTNVNGAPYAGGGGAPHSILSVTHDDSTPSVVARGDLITGQGVAPTWTALAIGGAGTYLYSDGTDVSWNAVAAGDVTAALNLTDNAVVRGDGGAKGVQTSLVTISDAGAIYTPADIDTDQDVNAGNDVNVTNDLDVTDDGSIGGDFQVTGSVGIGLAPTGNKVDISSSAGGAGVKALNVAESSNNAGSAGIAIMVSGAKTGSTYGQSIINSATSASAAVSKYGLGIRSQGVWNGAGANNYGLYIENVTGGSSNYSIYSEGGYNYLGGHLGVATAPSAIFGMAFDETKTITDNNNNLAVAGTYRLSKTSAVYTGIATGSLGQISVQPANDKNWTDTLAIRGFDSRITTEALSTGTITGAANYYGLASVAGATITNRYGMYIADATGAGTVTNQYGIYLENMTKGGTLNYSIYSAGGANYLAGGLTLGVPLAIADGGTGQATKAAAFDALSPMTTLGDIIYEDATPTATRLAGDTSDTRKFLRELSIGGVAQAPAWDTVTKTDVGLANVENTALSTWAGSANITTLGTIGSGTWNGGVISPVYGGTGIANNVASTLTISGNFATTLTITAGTNVTLPTTGTLATLAGAEELDNKTLDASVGKGTWTASGTWTLPAISVNDTITLTNATPIIKSANSIAIQPSGDTDDYLTLSTAGDIPTITGTGATEVDVVVGAGTYGVTATGLDFNTLKAIEMSCDNGTTLPASPVIGQWFLHTPTGRSILYQYTTAWQPIESFGTMTVYVDSTDGTDDAAHGTAADASAFKTISYAVSTIPGLVGGNVTININAETYAEDVVIRGKYPAGNYTITLQGTLTVHDNIVMDGNGVQGTGATQASIHEHGMTTNHYQNQLLKFTSGSNNGLYRIIDSNSNDAGTANIVLCGDQLTAQPLTNDTATVYTWGTTIQTITTYNQPAIVIDSIKFSATGTTHNITGNNQSYLTIYRCYLTSVNSEGICGVGGSIIYVYDCVYISGGNTSNCIGYDSQSFSFIRCHGCKSSGTAKGDTTIGGRSTIGGLLQVRNGSVFDLHGTGLQVTQNSTLGTYSSYINIFISNNTTGISAIIGGKSLYTAYVSYAGNDSNETSEAASYSYID